MSNKTKLRIGEFSQMMQVTVKTLRHYEQKGLLLPDEVDEWTVEHGSEYTPTNIDIEYCEQVEEMGIDSAIIKFKKLQSKLHRGTWQRQSKRRGRRI